MLSTTVNPIDGLRFDGSAARAAEGDVHLKYYRGGMPPKGVGKWRRDFRVSAKPSRSTTCCSNPVSRTSCPQRPISAPTSPARSRSTFRSLRRRWTRSPRRAWRSRWRRPAASASSTAISMSTDALVQMKDHGFSGIPVVTGAAKGIPGKLVGILTNRDVRFATDPRQKISELMTHENLVTVREGVSQDEAKRMLHKHRIEKLLVVDDQYRCVGLITVKDMEKAVAHPLACKDAHGRLRVAAATTVGDTGFERTERLIDAGVDVIVVDTAHGHSSRVLAAVNRIKRLSNAVQVIAGNIATMEGAQALIDAGADAIKVGIGPGSICTTRIVAGVGVPQLTAIMDAVE